MEIPSIYIDVRETGLIIVVSHLHENEGTAAYEGMDLSLSLDID